MSVIKNRKEDMKDRLAALMIYLELKACTNPNTFISSTDLMTRLEERYGKENAPSHNTVAKYLKAMSEYSDDLGIDVRKGNSRQGYCLAEREFSETEIRIFIEAILNSKTLSAYDKKEMVDKCFLHLGYEDEEIEGINDYLLNTKEEKHKKKTEREDIQKTLEILQSAIRNKKQVSFQRLPSMQQKDSNVRVYFRHCVSPYKVFTYEDTIYLMYGLQNRMSKVMKPFILNYIPVKDIHEIALVKGNNYYPIENYEPFRNGISEAKLRKDPFGYIKERKKETVRLELFSDSETRVKRIKRSLQEQFGEDVSFGTANGKTYAYIPGEATGLEEYLLNNSDKCIVVAPEKWKIGFRIKLKKALSIYQGEVTFEQLNGTAQSEHKRGRIKVREEEKK